MIIKIIYLNYEGTLDESTGLIYINEKHYSNIIEAIHSIDSLIQESIIYNNFLLTLE